MKRIILCIVLLGCLVGCTRMNNTTITPTEEPHLTVVPTETSTPIVEPTYTPTPTIEVEPEYIDNVFSIKKYSTDELFDLLLTFTKVDRKFDVYKYVEQFKVEPNVYSENGMVAWNCTWIPIAGTNDGIFVSNCLSIIAIPTILDDKTEEIVVDGNYIKIELLFSEYLPAHELYQKVAKYVNATEDDTEENYMTAVVYDGNHQMFSKQTENYNGVDYTYYLVSVFLPIKEE